MKLHRFFIEQEDLPKKGLPKEAEDFDVVDKNLLNQWRNVLRMEACDKAVLFDGKGEEALCEFVSLSKKLATLKVIEKKQGIVPTRDVTLYLALIKKDNFEFVLEKATELGVSRIVPVQADRSEKKGVNYERAQKIVREASEQSGRAAVPTLDEVIPVSKIPTEGLVVLDPRGEISAREYFAKNITAPISVFVGPEGGFTDAEIELFHAKKIPVVTTGEQILRAETAAVVALTLALVK
ncbi:MAG: 16S rRNA (uracil(1498)-N(3))-methyltransferase [Candidatus Pacebacteria bacterium]|jgi:16S rRNA (uracil1498-N3)-methyltransferase|nr:16S rRNA (uracil(1498)-N(3))-methyltransferase [Candidatus Paceibacterota bacterium]